MDGDQTPPSEQQRPVRGFNIHAVPPGAATDLGRDLFHALGLTDLHARVIARTHLDPRGTYLSLRLVPELAAEWAPDGNTLGLSSALRLQPEVDTDLTREIVVALLLSPILVEFPSMAEFHSAVRIRLNIVRASRKTMLAFHTSQADRPADCWRYDEDHGFVIRPQASLIAALTKATQPDASGQLYAFSCYRATEYVIVLAIAQEVEHCNPALFERLQTLWTARPIKSGQFHEVFLQEMGSMDAPLPPRYFVPGDRTWFRNPDEASADASGFEGSWVMYLGGGKFSNFWNRDQPFTLTEKCVEIYHWRHAVYIDDEGEPRIDEGQVAERVQSSAEDAEELGRILALMANYREPRGVYTAAGGCIDTTRECARWVHLETSDILLPDA
jgi:Protein-glutamine gamma-glutamyltransferase